MQCTLGLFLEFYFSLANYQDKKMYTGSVPTLLMSNKVLQYMGLILPLLAV